MFAPRSIRALASVTLLASALTACGDKPAEEDRAAIDPAIAAALADPLMTDPDLVAQNRAGAALSGGGVPSTLIPTDSVSEETKAAAKEEAITLTGGKLVSAPMVSGNDNSVAGETVLLSYRNAFGDVNCADKASYTFGWAAKMPEPFAIYPRGHVQESAGVDGADCRLRAINFRTGVAASDVLDFYATRARKTGYSADHRSSGDAHALSGKKGGAGYAVYVRPGPEGLTEVDLVTNGG